MYSTLNVSGAYHVIVLEHMEGISVKEIGFSGSRNFG